MSRHGDGDCDVDDNDDENLNERMITDPEGYPGKEGTNKDRNIDFDEN